MILQAPYPMLQTTTVLPNPAMGDGETLVNTIDVKHSINGTLYSYVKSNARSKLQYTVTMTRMKALELRAFILAYYRAKVLLTNHKGEQWVVNFVSNPFEFASQTGVNPMMELTIELEGYLIQPVTPSVC